MWCTETVSYTHLDVYKRQENYSFVLDLKLLMMTVKIFFQKEVSEGVNDNQTNALKDSVDPVKELSEKEPVDPEEKE